MEAYARHPVKDTCSWRDALSAPAVCVDSGRGSLFVHGGKVNTKRVICSTLYKVSLLKDPGLCCIVYDDAQVDSNSADELRGPSLYQHVAFVFRSYLVVHGGKDRNEVVRRDTMWYHIESKKWTDLRGAMGGCSPPHMYAHAATCIDASDGVYAVVGTEVSPNGLPIPLKRGRDRSYKPSAQLSVYLVHMTNFTKGWEKRLAHNEGPTARENFSLTPSTDGKYIYVAGGKTRGSSLYDVWQFDMVNDIWRNVYTVPAMPVRGKTVRQSRICVLASFARLVGTESSSPDVVVLVEHHDRGVPFAESARRDVLTRSTEEDEDKVDVEYAALDKRILVLSHLSHSEAVLGVCTAITDSQVTLLCLNQRGKVEECHWFL